MGFIETGTRGFLNVIIQNGNVCPNDASMLFPEGEKIEEFKPGEVDIFDLLVKLGSFESKSQAKKNWKGPNKIPDGWTHFKVGKFKRELCIWNPTEKLSEDG